MARPIRVGILNDMSDGPPGSHDIEPWLRFAAQERIASGRIDRDVEFIQAYGLGLPGGTAAAIGRAVASLVEQDVLLIVGPPIGDNAMVAAALADSYRIPVLNWAGSERGRSDYLFQLQVGSHEEDAIVVARHVHAQGIKRVAVVYDRSRIGQLHFAFFLAEAQMLGLQLSAMATISPIAGDATGEMVQLVDSGPDGIVYLAIGEAAAAAARALSALAWDGLRVLNTAGIRGYDPAIGAALDGRSTRRLGLRRYVFGRKPHPGGSNAAPGRSQGEQIPQRRPLRPWPARRRGHARAAGLTPDLIRDGLERIKWLPAAEGYDGSLLGFGKCDRAALHGRYLVMRTWRAGESIEVISK